MKNRFEEIVVLEKFKNDLQHFVNANLVRCPNCSEINKWEDSNYNPAENEYTCPNCRFTENQNDFEIINILDYFEDIYMNYLTTHNDEGEDYE